MPTGSRILKSATKIAIGDMDTKVTLYERKQSAPLNTKYQLHLQEIGKPWTMWEVKGSGVQIFDGTNLLGTATDIFTMYYIEKVAKKTDCGTLFIEYNNSLYKCLSVKTLDKRCREFMTLYCCEQGKTTADKKSGVNIL